jgi:mRNA deadenylase 3'-5' endonuclease subunit Ccr4
MKKMILKNKKEYIFCFIDLDDCEYIYQKNNGGSEFIDFNNCDSFLKKLIQKDGFDCCFDNYYYDLGKRKIEYAGEHLVKKVLCYDKKTGLYFLVRLKIYTKKGCQNQIIVSILDFDADPVLLYKRIKKKNNILYYRVLEKSESKICKTCFLCDFLEKVKKAA